MIDRDSVERTLPLAAVIHERDRPALAAALEKAKAMQAHIPPIDTTLPDDLLESVVVVWLVYGDGTGTTPDYVDEVNSTWLVTA